MGESNLDDLILAEPEEGKQKQKGILVILDLVILLLVLGVILANMIFGGPEDVNKTKSNDSQAMEIKKEPKVAAVAPTTTNNKENLDLKEDLDADLAPLDDENTDNLEVIKATDEKANAAKKEQKAQANKANDEEEDTQEKTTAKKEKKVVKKEKPKPVVKHKPKPKPVAKPKPAPVHKTRKVYGGSGNVYIQVGSFSKGPNQAFIDKIRRAGFKFRIKEVNGLRKVLVGPFRSESEARSLLGIVKSKIAPNAFVKTN